MWGFLDTLRRLWRTKRWIKWLVYALPVLAVLALLGPALGVLHQILKLVVGFLLPLLQSPGGRFLIVNLAVIAIVLVLYWKGRTRVRSLLAYVALRHFLRGLQLLSSGFTRKAAVAFHRVIRMARWVNLEEALPAYPEVAADAKVRLALCHLRTGEVDEALRWLELARKDRPPAEVMKRLRELRAVAYFYHPTLARETGEKELLEAQRRDPDNPRLNRALVEKAESEGDAAQVLELRRRIYQKAEGRDREREVVHLLETLFEQARQAMEAGDLNRARALLREAQALQGDVEPVQLLLGDVEMRRQNPDAALRAWSRVPGPAARARVARVLGCYDDPREVLRRYPQAEVLLDLADRMLERGVHDQARRMLDKARELGADEVETEKALGDLAVAETEPMVARTHYLKAVTRLFGGRFLPPGSEEG